MLRGDGNCYRYYNRGLWGKGIGLDDVWYGSSERFAARRIIDCVLRGGGGSSRDRVGKGFAVYTCGREFWRGDR